MDNNTNTLAIVLSAGEGTRMKSSLPKVLHKVAQRTMLGHVLAAVECAQIAHVATVVGPNRQDVIDETMHICPHAKTFEQTQRLGTAHAVLCAQELLKNNSHHVVVLYADTPLLSAHTITQLLKPIHQGAAVVVAGFQSPNPQGYGRLIMKGENLDSIREEKDASDSEKTITLCNAGLMALHKDHAYTLLKNIGNNNAKNEYYLTDAVELANKNGLSVRLCTINEQEVMGVNDRAQLAIAEHTMQEKLRAQHLANGITMHNPQSVYFAYDTVLEKDVTLEPNIVFGPKVVVQSHSIIHAFSHLEGATVAKNSSIGPFARLRPGTTVGEGARIGNFVEIKKSTLHDGAKVNHLSYIGDATVGAKANIGAGTITCNYDGKNKFETIIGENAFIGSNSALVAPVKIGNNALIGAGSVIVQNVPDNTLSIARGRQVIKNKK